MLIKIESGQAVGNPLTEAQFRALFPNVSFTRPLEPQAVLERGYAFYRDSLNPQPERYEVVEESAPVQVDQASWEKGETVRPMTSEEIDAVDVSQEQNVRLQRNSRLGRSDWTQFGDSPLTESEKASWRDYRQALRDVPAQSGFPWEVNWPEEPV